MDQVRKDMFDKLLNLECRITLVKADKKSLVKDFNEQIKELNDEIKEVVINLGDNEDNIGGNERD